MVHGTVIVGERMGHIYCLDLHSRLQVKGTLSRRFCYILVKQNLTIILTIPSIQICFLAIQRKIGDTAPLRLCL